MADNQAPFIVIDSILSEEAVLGFEYGYATADPNTLVIWEAQFGDFANGAQVVIDQFIASGEVKWGRANGLTLMLPHGYEGQGPEHSSARLERFMQLCADNNMQVVPPTPAQIFHLLRRQMVRMLRKPLVIMTPKSLLRNKDATSPLSELTKGEFQTVIPTPDRPRGREGQARGRLLGQGLLRPGQAARREGHDDVAIVRVEQLYPFPHKAFAAELKKYPNATESSGARTSRRTRAPGSSIQHNIHENMSEGSRSWATPAVRPRPRRRWATAHLHHEQQKALVDAAFGKLKGFVLTYKYGRIAGGSSRVQKRLRGAQQNSGKNKWLSSKSRFRNCPNRLPKRPCCSGRRSPASRGADEILIEIETDKVVLEVPAPSAGVLAEIVSRPTAAP